MDTPDFLQPLLQYPEVIAQFIERVPGVPVSLDRDTAIENLTPIHRAEIERLGSSWKYLRRAEQVHGNKVALVGDIGSHCPIEGVDGLVCSGKADCILGIYVADCAAVWLYDKHSHGCALLHSGKRGTEQNIIACGMEHLRKFCGGQASETIAVISPCIRPPHYEVDIPATIKSQLLACGVLAENIYDSGLNTATNTQRFYSYRAEKGETGRMMALFGKKLPALNH